MRTPLALLCVLALAGGTLAACGDDDGGSGSSDDAAQTTGSPTVDGARVGMRNLRFDPEEITVAKGEKVTWVNDESIQHNVVAKEGADFESELLDQGQTFEFTPDDEGTIDYTCTLHPGMDGKVTVTG